MADHQSHRTRDHETIRRWAEERGGQPASVKGTERGSDEAGILRMDFPGRGEDDKLEPISWDEFFEKFDETNLEFLYQDKTQDGGTSRFFKFVASDTPSHGRSARKGEDGGRGRQGGRR